MKALSRVNIHNRTIGGRTENSERLFKEIEKGKRLTKEDENKLILKYQKTGCSECKKKVIESNLLFCAKVARTFMFKDHPTLGFDDMFNQAYEGIEVALNRFDVTTGNKFISYAVSWMTQRCTSYRNDQRIGFKVPKINGFIYKAMSDTWQKGEELTHENVYNNLPESCKGKFSPQTIKDFMLMSECPSLDKPITEEWKGEALTILDSYECNQFMPDASFENSEEHESLLRYVHLLKDRQKQIVEMYFGLNGHTQSTLNEIAFNMELTRERIRQIKEKALIRLGRWMKKGANIQAKLFL